jgi:thiaminase/transcriptional activator TenA
MTELYAGFGATLRRETDDLWHSILDHPFVRGLGDGTLSEARFRTWLAQDYPYLVSYARVLALGAAAAEDLAGLRFYADQLSMTLTHEMALHQRNCAAFGIDEARLAAVVPDEVPLRYAEHLLEVGRGGVEANLIAALLPCAVGYVEIGESLAARGLPDVPAYRDWIETYTSEPMYALAAWLVARLDRFAADADDDARKRWRETYRTSTDFERRFFQMAWEERGTPPPAPSSPTR